MRFGFIAALAMAILGIVAVFITNPIISDFAFWVIVIAYIVLSEFGEVVKGPRSC
jgi:hypothetical protein